MAFVYGKQIMRINNKVVDNQSSTLIIAEIGMNHNGSFDTAIQLIDQSKHAGADIVKFQLRHLDEVYSHDSLNNNNADLSTQYTIDLLNKFQLSIDEYKRLFDYCESIDMNWICTPWDKKSLAVLESFNCPAYKIASADFTNTDLIATVTSTKKPIILSTGMSTEEEIYNMIKFLKDHDADYALLHCNSTYPTPFKDIHLNYLDTFKSFDILFGYSGHERGVSVSIAAVAMGAKIIERHITLDRSMEGTDHAASLEVNEFKMMVEGIREVEQALGENKPRTITQGEMINRDNISKSIYITTNISSGTTFEANHFEFKSPGIGLKPYQVNQLIGQPAAKDYSPGNCLFLSDLNQKSKHEKSFNFSIDWGIPVRPRDFQSMITDLTTDLVEFHFSYKDLDIPITEYLTQVYDLDFIVHVPELFEGDHLLDLCTADTAYRQVSIDHMKRIVELTQSINKYFPKTKRPKIVIHCGGFTMDDHMPLDSRPKYYERLATALADIDDPSIELLPENMAPFPWHFGGQRYQNIFVDADEILNFCNTYNYRICQDISHSFLACNHFNWDHLKYTETLASISAHYHISDGTGVDGEGLQVDEGKINFPQIGAIIKKLSPSDTSFIPEIWQGHKNNGEGFWTGLKNLEQYL
jgi:sialic acid synthase SpsE/sugar phosphate isomerase/epimerase